MKASPVIDGETVYLTANDATVTAVDLVTGVEQFSGAVMQSPDWPDVPVTTPALAGGRLFLTSPAVGLHALDPATLKVLWQAEVGGPGVVSPETYGDSGTGVMAPPVVTGDLVWVGGVDGVVRALDASTGHERFSLDLGVPVLASMVPSGRNLFVGTWDGTVHALRSVEATAVDATDNECLCSESKPPASPGCGCQAGAGWAGRGAGLLLLVAAVALAIVRRQRRRLAG